MQGGTLEPARRTRRIGIRDVAEHAGVSIATVSNALNRPQRVSDATRTRVSAAVEQLGYAPSPAARMLRAQKSGLIGMTVINIRNPFFGALISGAEQAAAARSMRVFSGNVSDSAQTEKDHLGLFRSVHVEGALITPFGDTSSAIRSLRSHGIPVVLVDGADETGTLSSVSFDNRTAADMVARHLLETGRRRVLFLGSRRELAQVRDREDGAREVLAAAGSTMAAERLHRTDPEAGLEYGAKLAAGAAGDLPDAIICSNDHLAAGLVRALVDGGVRVPEDVAVVGYDDTPLSRVAAVPLTSIRQPAVDMGRRAAELLLGAIGRSPEPRQNVVYAPELVIRASTVG
ncbi:LacI family DNA-binding transcriptional regulator [Microbacterium halophytorum]|uniref:LacI family DNA-binding transcriptional regulator n=1 Tax=Microbacterium halophytorum TaxID=2067568 RepID=UPI000CFBEBF0|nr:LacI family DNA-binding transcriptional regulator [Microbacterium halophytorum]